MKYRKIFALLLAAATLFSLAACGETAAGPEATPDPALDESAATVSGQTLTFAGAADDVFSLSLDYEESLNPVKTQSTLNQLVDCLVYDRLFEVDENFNVTSRILSDWYYSKNEDSAGVWVLKVREGIQMHDGSTLTAQDVAYSVSCIFTSERHKHLQQQVGARLFERVQRRGVSRRGRRGQRAAPAAHEHPGHQVRLRRRRDPRRIGPVYV